MFGLAAFGNRRLFHLAWFRSGSDSDRFEKIVESGLDWETARRKAVELNIAEGLANPEKTSWALDLYLLPIGRHQSPPEAHEHDMILETGRQEVAETNPGAPRERRKPAEIRVGSRDAKNVNVEARWRRSRAVHGRTVHICVIPR